MSIINRIWYQSHPIKYLLWPLSGLFRLLIKLRRYGYRLGICTTKKFPCPVIIVGNITVGGCGKTPLVIHLVKLLQQQGYKPGVVSRGYGGKMTDYPACVSTDSDLALVGDEAIVIKRQMDCPVVIAPKRTKAVEFLLDKFNCNIIISDDGLQHYALARDIEIVVIDGQRRFGNQACLPAGPLREPISRLETVDLIVTHGEAKENEYGMHLQGDRFVNITDHDQCASADDFQQKKLRVVTGLGNPQRFFDQLHSLGLNFTEHVFPDHYPFQRKDFPFKEDEQIIMTEKDAVKCESFADDRFWYLPVTAQLEQAFTEKFLLLLSNFSN